MMIMCWSTTPGLRNPSSDIQILVGRVEYAYKCCSHESFFFGFMVSAQSQFYTSIDSQSVLIANPISHFSLVFLCISVTGTGTEGGERVGRGFDIR